MWITAYLSRVCALERQTQCHQTEFDRQVWWTPSVIVFRGHDKTQIFEDRSGFYDHLWLFV